MNKQKVTNIFYIFLFIQFIVLLFVANSLDISPKEATLFYSSHHNLLWYLTHIFTDIFGQNNIALRLPFILFYLSSLYISFQLCDDYFKKPIDRLISITILALLPGMNSAALLVDNAIIVIFGTLLYLYMFKLYKQEYYLLLIIFFQMQEIL